MLRLTIRLATFPFMRKRADLIFFPKPNKYHTFPQNYRAISLLSAISKMAERIILERLKRHNNNHTLIPSHQFGFRAGHSTTYQLLRATEFAASKMNIISQHVVKAFDTVWHDSLILKMYSHGIPTPLVRVVHSFLSDLCFGAPKRCTHLNANLFMSLM